MPAALRKLLCPLLCLWHLAMGRISFRFGTAARARRHFERVLQLRGDCYSAYLHLGRIAFLTGDFQGSRREFEHARRVDPERFARMRRQLDPFTPGGDGSPWSMTGERATWRVTVPGPATATARPESTEPEVTPAIEPAPPRRACQDDCQSSAERARLDRCGPIRADEVRAADLDDLCRRLGA
jgi:hypothetical protein